jgi:hypothetical protein
MTCGACVATTTTTMTGGTATTTTTTLRDGQACIADGVKVRNPFGAVFTSFRILPSNLHSAGRAVTSPHIVPRL